MSSISTSHALDPVAGHGHDHGDVEEKKTSTLQANQTKKVGFNSGEIVYAIVLMGGLLAVIFGTAAALAIGVWVFHLVFHLLSDFLTKYHLANFTPRDAEAWGNAVGTVSVIVLGFVMILATLLTMGERKWSAMMQDRIGPNQARIALPGIKNSALFGLPHILADVLKMLTKEELVPASANKLIFHLAPAVAFCPAFVLFAVIPMAPKFMLWGYVINMQVAPIDQGLLYVFAVASLAVLGTSLAGWSSNNKYALLGGVRASAQMISYEVTLGMTLVGLMIIFHSLRLDTISQEQGEYLWGIVPKWGLVFQPLAVFAYFAAAHAEIKRGPFDLPEGESEIVGYFIEYSGLKFGIFMIAEFVEVVVFAGLFTVLFFGSYHIPWVDEHWLNERIPHDVLQLLAGSSSAGWWHDFAKGLGTGLVGFIYLTSFLVKTVFFCWLSLAARWTFPRFRYDQVMTLGWKILLPVSLANVIITGLVVLMWGVEGAAIVGLIEGAIVLLFVIGAFNISRTGVESLLPSEGAAAAAHGGGHH